MTRINQIKNSLERLGISFEVAEGDQAVLVRFVEEDEEYVLVFALQDSEIVASIPKFTTFDIRFRYFLLLLDLHLGDLELVHDTDDDSVTLRASLDSELIRDESFRERICQMTSTAVFVKGILPKIVEGLSIDEAFQGENILFDSLSKVVEEGDDNLQLLEEMERLVSLAHLGEGDIEALEEAISGYTLLTSTFDADNDPEFWAMNQYALGNLYLNQYKQSGEGWEEAERAFLNSLQVYHRKNAPSDWAEVQHYLGSLYGKRYERTGEGWEKAEQAYLNALEERSPDHTPEAWADTQYALGALYESLYERSGKSWEKAEQAYLSASKIQRREKLSIYWAITQHALGNLFSGRYRQSGEDWEKAEQAYLSALEVFQRDRTPTDWATTLYSLGNLYSTRYVQNGEAWEKAEQAYVGALDEFLPEVDPLACANASQQLARLLVRLGRTDEAIGYLNNALSASQTRLDLAISEQQRIEIASELAQLQHQRAFLFSLDGKVKEAFVAVDAGRTSVIAQVVGLEARAFERGGERLRDELNQVRRHRLDAEAKVRAFEATLAGVEEEEQAQLVRGQLRAAHTVLKKADKEFRNWIENAGLDTNPLDASNIEQIELGNDTALVSFVFAHRPEPPPIAPGDRSMQPVAMALVRFEEEFHIIDLPRFSHDDVYRLVFELPGEIQAWIETFNESGKNQKGWTETAHRMADNGDVLANAGWIYAYRVRFEVAPYAQRTVASNLGAVQVGWKGCVERILGELQERVWLPLLAKFGGYIRKILVIPTGLTAVLPLHAAAPDDITVGIAPSLGIWNERRQEVDARGSRELLLATPAKNLLFAGFEAMWIKERWEKETWLVKHFDQDEANVQSVLAHASDKGIIHYSGHARYNWNAPQRSGLSTWGKPLTLERMRMEMKLHKNRLIILSACSTGVCDVLQEEEEMVGLPTALIESGAAAVVGSLWPVHDISTALLMDRFYEVWIRGKGTISIASALREAALWLRDASKDALIEQIRKKDKNKTANILAISEIKYQSQEYPFAHPFYWAAFTAFGAVI